MISRYTARVPYLGQLMFRLEAQKERVLEHWPERPNRDQGRAKNIDSHRAVWTPPLSPSQAHCLEERQIQRKFQLPGLVSITDHDDIKAGTLLRVLDPFRKAPISTEWTIPFGPTFFHLGIHNMPETDSSGIMEQLRAFTEKPEIENLQDTLAMLNSYPGILLVLNHPLWDEKGIGVARHAEVVTDMLAHYGRFFHALEVNGFRPWNENQKIMALGQQTTIPVVSGGDRHGCEPNAILNLSQAATFEEFIHEVRRQRVSHVVFMPQYHEPLKLRIVQTILDVICDYPENLEGRRYLPERLFYRGSEYALPVPLTSIWSGDARKTLSGFFSAIRLLEWHGFRSALRFALSDQSSKWCDREAAA
ncbi:MAG: hypothetical protein ACR2JB_00200 [Bryobacteraceae bacterium]